MELRKHTNSSFNNNNDNGIPFKLRRSNNNSPFSRELIKTVNNNSLPITNESYLTFLKANIPILDIGELWNNIMDFVYAINGITGINEEPYNIQECIDKINECLTEMNNVSEFNFNTKNMNNLKDGKVFKNKKNKIVLKKHPLTAESLIEAIIQLTLHYYDKDVTLLSTLYKKNGKLMQKMNFSKKKTLGSIIAEVYSLEVNDNDKDKILLDILIKIAHKLNYLQQTCGFIHGDFHTLNIFYNPDTGIQLIDFGFSFIRLPGTNLIIYVPNEKNNGVLYGINSNNNSESVDLFHLIESLDKYDNMNRMNTLNYKKIIKKITDRYFKRDKKKIYISQSGTYKGDTHVFSRSSHFLEKNKKLSPFEYLRPSQFIQFTFDSNNELYHPLDLEFPKRNNNLENSGREKKLGGISRSLF
jgi:hypothetical protein